MSRVEPKNSTKCIYTKNGDMKFSEIAKELGLNTGNVMYAYKTAMAKIKKNCDEKTYTYLLMSLESESLV